MIEVKSAIEHVFNMLKSKEDIAYDVETDGLKWQKTVVVGYSFSDGKEAHYIPVRHEPGGNIENPEGFEREIQRIISQREADLITHNGKFDSHQSINHGIELSNKIKDTMIAAALLDENARSYSLENVAARLPDIPQKKGAELYEYMRNKLPVAMTKKDYMGHFFELSGDDPMAHEYAGGDTLTTWHVREKQKKGLYTENLEFVYNLENRLLHVLRKMERRGISVDMAELDRVKKEVEDLQVEAYQNIPLKDDLTPINIRSGKDLQEYFEMHNLTDWEFTAPTEKHPNGQPSFTKGFLEQSDAGRLLLQAKAVDHFKNSFVDPIDQYIYDGVIYTNFNQTQGEYSTGTKTGRLSCTQPNMQQVPKRDEQLGRIFRKLFVARPGFTFVEFDYSQAEPRLFSHYSDEKILIEGYNSSPAIDMHDIAAKYMGITRKKAKNLNLGLQYTMGVAKLAKQLHVPEQEAREMYYRWKRTFPNVSQFTKMASQVAEQRGYVKTILGRRARFPDPRWSYRSANRIVQGGSADILKYAMVKLDDWIVLTNQEDDIRMLLNIHDAILFEIRDEILGKSIVNIKRIMEDVQRPPFNLKVPFVADYKTGKTWAEATYE